MKKNRIAFQGGIYTLAVVAVVLAILIGVNVFASFLPATVTKLDISSARLYSVTSNTKAVVNNLQQDVTIYWIVQADEEDDILSNLLSKYDSLSDHIEVVKKNPDVFPTFASQYTDETVANNSLVVESGERSRYIAFEDIYPQDVDMYSYSYTTSFDGEGAITSAIDYVVNEALPKMYLLEGHGEQELPAGLTEQLEKANIETESLSLPTVDAVPEDADGIIIYAPASDLSEEESSMLADYTAGGGKLLVMAGPTEEEELPENLYSLLADYGVAPNEGVLVEADRMHYAFQEPYILLPDLGSHAVTDPLIEENYYVMMPISLGLTVQGSSEAVTPLLTTSEESFSKIAGFGLTTYEKEDGDIDGPFTVGVFVDCGNSGQMIWFASSEFINDMYNAYSSGANANLVMNAVSSMVGESEAMAIRSKSLNYNYLTISESTSSLLKALMIGVFPLYYLGIGILVVLRRRKLQNETIE